MAGVHNTRTDWFLMGWQGMWAYLALPGLAQAMQQMPQQPVPPLPLNDVLCSILSDRPSSMWSAEPTCIWSYTVSLQHEAQHTHLSQVLHHEAQLAALLLGGALAQAICHRVYPIQVPLKAVSMGLQPVLLQALLHSLLPAPGARRECSVGSTRAQATQRAASHSHTCYTRCSTACCLRQVGCDAQAQPTTRQAGGVALQSPLTAKARLLTSRWLPINDWRAVPP